MVPHLLTLLVCLAPPQEGDLLNGVPPGAQVVLSIRSVEALHKALHDSAWGRFLKDSEMKRLFDHWEKHHGLAFSLDEPINEEEDAPTYREALEAIPGPMVSFIELKDMEEGGGGVLVVPGEDPEPFDRLRTALENRFYESEDFTDSADSYNEVDILIWESAAAEEERKRCIFFAQADEAAVLALHTRRESGLAMVQGILDNLRGEGAVKSILDSEAFLKARDRTGGRGDVEFFADVHWFLDAVFRMSGELKNEEDQSLAATVRRLIGVDDFGPLYGKAVVGRGENMDLAVHLDIEGNGLVRKALNHFTADAPLDLMKYAPVTAATFSAMSMDLPGLYGLIMEVLKSQSKEAYDQYRGYYDDLVVQRFNIDPEKEILEQLNGRMATFSTEVPVEEMAFMIGLEDQPVEVMVEAGLNYGEVYLIGIKDATVFQNNFNKLLRAFGVYVSLKKEDFQGQMIYSIQIPMITGLRVFWVFSDELFAISAFPTALRSYVRLLAHGEQPTVAERDDFAGLAQEHLDASSVTVGETALLVKSLLTGFQSGLEALEQVAFSFGGEGEDVRSAPKPFRLNDSVVDKYFRGVMGYFLKVDEEGVLLELILR